MHHCRAGHRATAEHPEFVQEPEEGFDSQYRSTGHVGGNAFVGAENAWLGEVLEMRKTLGLAASRREQRGRFAERQDLFRRDDARGLNEFAAAAGRDPLRGPLEVPTY